MAAVFFSKAVSTAAEARVSRSAMLRKLGVMTLWAPLCFVRSNAAWCSFSW